MLTKRIIACLDVDDGRVVKGVQFVNLRDAGDPAECAAAHAAMARMKSFCSISRPPATSATRCSTWSPARHAVCLFRSRSAEESGTLRCCSRLRRRG